MRKNKIQQSLHCADCVEKGSEPSLEIGFDNDDRLVVVCLRHEARLQEFKLKYPTQVMNECEQVVCDECVEAKVEMVKLDVGISRDGRRLIVACKEHGTLLGAFELAEPITLAPCPDCGAGAVGPHAH
jgi:hypothetical protein